jgi:hypothetical protein
MMDGASIIDRINKRGALINVLDKPHLDLTTPIGRGFIAALCLSGRCWYAGRYCLVRAEQDYRAEEG